MEQNYFIHVHSQGEDTPIRTRRLCILLRETISAISAAILEGKQPLPRGFQKLEREIYQRKKQHQLLERLSRCNCSKGKYRHTVGLNHLNTGASTFDTSEFPEHLHMAGRYSEGSA